MSGQLYVRQVKSSIGSKPKHRGTLRALGLGRIGKSNTLPDRPEIRGQIARVPHLIIVEEVTAAEAAKKAPARKSAKVADPVATALATDKAEKPPAEKAEKAPAKKAAAKKAPAKKAAATKKAATAKKAPAKKAAAAKKADS
jgi:large subunit ribosomal protein L30